LVKLRRTKHCAIFGPPCIFIQIFVVRSERRTCFETVRNGLSRSPKVVDFGTNRKRACDFLLVINSNLGNILPRFRDIAGFRTARPRPYSTRIFGVFPLDYIDDVVAPRREDPTLIIYVINFELFQPVCPVCPRYINVTDRWTDGRTTYDSNTALALHASHGKKLLFIRSASLLRKIGL